MLQKASPPCKFQESAPEVEALDLGQIAYEAEQQAARVRALLQALAKAHYDEDEELWFEALAQLLDPVCCWTSTLSWELNVYRATGQDGTHAETS